MTKTHTFFLVTFAVVILASLSLEITNDQHNAEYLSKAPLVSNVNTPKSSLNILQKSAKDIVFIENLGQITDTKGEKRPDILFLTRSEGVDMYMTNSGITYVFRNEESGIHRLDMEFVGMNKNVNIKKELSVEQQYNYYTPEYPYGISPSAYKKLTFENIYEGIDLVYYEKEGRMKYDFIVKAGADAGKIKMKYKGAKSMDIDNNGAMIITTPMGEIREEKPYTYSKNTGSEIKSSYRVKNNSVLFDIAEYDKSEEIIIDPVRMWATYFGGDLGEKGWGVCTDNSGNLYVTGTTAGGNFPTQSLSGAYNDTTYGGGNYDAFIVKFNSSGAKLWTTYYGGNLIDMGFDICTDNSGNLYVTGRTRSTDFPTQTLTGAYNQPNYGGSDSDAFILKFTSSGARLWATYYGGNYWDIGWSIRTDISGNLYVTGSTNSTNFPTQSLSGAYNQATNAGTSDTFILKFNSSGVRQWATYYGGSGLDAPGVNPYLLRMGLCTDSSGNFYITGRTGSSDFPIQTLTGAYNQTTSGGGYDAFILKFDSTGARQWATYYGGSGIDAGCDICTDNSGNVYVTGQTESSDFPVQTLTGAYNQTTSGGDLDAFILKFNSNSARQWASYYGGSDLDRGYRDICTSNSGNLYVTGITASSDFPIQTLTGAYNQSTLGGGNDIYILEFNSSCARQWASYYGGSTNDQGWGLCTDNSGNLFFTGITGSSDFPTLTLTGAYNDSSLDGNSDAFILRISEAYAAFTASDDTVCEGNNLSFTDQSIGYPTSWDWTFEGGTPGTSTAQNPTITYNSTGKFDVQLIISNGIESDTLLKEDYITVIDTPEQADAPEGDTVVCTDNYYLYTTSEVDYAENYEWELTPADAGMLEVDENTASLTTADDWTGDFTIRVRATNMCDDGAWSDYLECTLYQSPDVFTLEGGGSYCLDGDGVEITLDGSQTGIDYELYLGGEPTGNIVSGTGSEISFGLVTDEGYYSCYGSNDNCSQLMTDQIEVTILFAPIEPETPTGPDYVCGEASSDYETTGSDDADSYGWMLSPEEAGTITGDSLTATVEWGEGYTGTAYISVYGINACGDGNPSEELEVSVGEPNPVIEGEAMVCDWSEENYAVEETSGSSYQWEVVGGTIAEGQGTSSVTIAWEGVGDGTLVVTETTADSCVGSSDIVEVTIDDCTGIGELDKEGTLTLSPNPTSGLLNVSYVTNENNLTVSVCNQLGQIIISKEIASAKTNKTIQFNITELTSGLYFIRIENANGLLEHKQFIKK